MKHCLIIGQHDPTFEEHLRRIRFTFGSRSGAYQDQDLTYITLEGKPYRAMDLLNLINRDHLSRPLSNLDFLWPTIAVLGTHLSKHGMQFDYVNQYDLEQQALKVKLESTDYLLVAITTTLYVTDTPIKDIVAFVRRYNRRALIIVGGPYIKNKTVETSTKKLDRDLADIGADIFVVSNEGQATLVNVILALQQGLPLHGVPNLIYRRGLGAPAAGARTPPAVTESETRNVLYEDLKQHVEENLFAFTPQVVEDNPLEQSLIDFDLFPREDVGRFASLSTAKSCPYGCLFCGFPSRAGAYKVLGVELVERQLDKLKELGVETLTFLDDTFNVPKPRFKDILRMMIRNRYGFKWNSFYRSDQGDDETIDLMAESGCEGVFLGIESASDEMLRRMNKTSRQKHYARAIPRLKANGIHTHANFIIGFPGETDESVLESLEFIKEFHPDTYKAQLWYADNTAPVWRMKEELGIRGIGFNWSHCSMTAVDAAAWIDRIYEEVVDSAFLPQESFGLWSVFYLQRKGMTKEQILGFLKLFQRAVLLKRKEPSRQEVPAELIAELFRVGRIRYSDSGK